MKTNNFIELYLIITAPGTFIDSYDGTLWETTTNRKTAWFVSRLVAEEKLKRVQKQFPEAQVIFGKRVKVKTTV